MQDPSKIKILIVDDNPANVRLVDKILKKQDFITGLAYGGLEAVEESQRVAYDLILLDIMMPDLDGYEACIRIKANPLTEKIPIIFLTAKNETKDITHAFGVGGVDFVHKPFIAAELTARISTQVELKLYRDKLEQRIVEETEKRLAVIELHQIEMIETQKEVIELMGTIAETRSKETGQHVRRVAEFSKLLALLHGMNEQEAEDIKMASPLHDIGKVGIPDHILHKPGKLTDEEFTIMKTHSELGYQMLQASNKELMKTAALIAHCHHEKWVGGGYPRGLKGEEIPIEGRLTAIADVFDALGATRAYKRGWTMEKIHEFFQENRGTHFDPKLTDLFLENFDQFVEIRNQNMDEIPGEET